MNVTIKLVLPGSPERAAVAEFIEEQYMRRMHVIPTIPETLFAAFLGKAIIGTVAVEFCKNEKTPLPFESIFAFDHSHLALPTSRMRSLQFSRWTTSAHAPVTEMSKKITLFATIYAIELHNKKCGWCELKKHTARLLRSFGIKLYKVPNATIRSENVPESVRSFYTTEPLPELYQLDLNQMVEALLT